MPRPLSIAILATVLAALSVVATITLQAAGLLPDVRASDSREAAPQPGSESADNSGGASPDRAAASRESGLEARPSARERAAARRGTWLIDRIDPENDWAQLDLKAVADRLTRDREAALFAALETSFAQQERMANRYGLVAEAIALHFLRHELEPERDAEALRARLGVLKRELNPQSEVFAGALWDRVWSLEDQIAQLQAVPRSPEDEEAAREEIERLNDDIRQLRTQITEALQPVNRQYEEAVRLLLTPEQAARYDGSVRRWKSNSLPAE